MEFELNKFDLCYIRIDKDNQDNQDNQDYQLIVECDLDAEYSPQDGIYNRFCWSLIFRNNVANISQDITDELSEAEFAVVEKQVEKFFEEFFND